MARASKYFIYAIWFFSGVFICYWFSQISYLEIDKSINIPETILTIISLLVGLFIALTLQSKLNRNQNFYGYVISKFDSLWEDYSKFYTLIDSSNQIPLANVNKFTKNFQQRIDILKQLVITFGLGDIAIKKIEDEFDKFEDILSNRSFYNQNIVFYDTRKVELQAINLNLNKAFLAVYSQICDTL